MDDRTHEGASPRDLDFTQAFEETTLPLFDEIHARKELPAGLATIEKTVMDTIDRPVPSGYLTFAQAKEKLGDSIDLDEVRGEAVKIHTIMGIPQTLVEAGIIESSADYPAYLQQSIIKEADIPKIQAFIESGGKLTALFVPPLSLPTLGTLMERDMPFDQNPYRPKTVAKRLTDWRVIDSKNIHNNDSNPVEPSPISGESQIKRKWRGLYEAASVSQDGGMAENKFPHLFFMPTIEPQNPQKETPSPAEVMEDTYTDENNYINPRAFLLHLWQSIIAQAENSGIPKDHIAEALKEGRITHPLAGNHKVVFVNFVERDGTVPSIGFYQGRDAKEQARFYFLSLPPDRVDPGSIYQTVLG